LVTGGGATTPSASTASQSRLSILSRSVLGNEASCDKNLVTAVINAIP
jgi:hypothetical protein